jgi:hypothetical protein
VLPSLESLDNGSWRGSRELYLVARPERLARAEGFLRFVSSAEGRALSRACGYLPPAAATP